MHVRTVMRPKTGLMQVKKKHEYCELIDKINTWSWPIELFYYQSRCRRRGQQDGLRCWVGQTNGSGQCNGKTRCKLRIE